MKLLSFTSLFTSHVSVRSWGLFFKALVALSLILGIIDNRFLHAKQISPSTQAQTMQTFQAEDIFELELASDPQVSPDGKTVVYVRRSHDIMTDSTRSSLWTVRTNADDHRPLVSSLKNAYSPRWSPSGDRIAYVSNKEGKSQLYVRWVDTGQTALITNITSSPSSITWSPNGNTIAFTMSVKADEKPFTVRMPTKPEGATWSPSFQYITKARYQADGRGVLEPAYTHIFVVPAHGGSARQLSSGPYHHRGAL